MVDDDQKDEMNESEAMGQAPDDSGDEYQFGDLDNLGVEIDPTSLSEDEVFEESPEAGMSSPPGRGRFDKLDPKMVKMARNGLLAVGGLILVVLGYKYAASFFTAKSSAKSSMQPVATQTQTKTASKAPLPIRPSTTATTPTTASTASSKSMMDTIGQGSGMSALKKEQARLEDEISTMRQQIRTVSQTVNDVASKMDDVKQTMLVLSERLEQQSRQMARLHTMSRSRRTASRASSESKPPARPAVQKTTYSIQAIIPGRAWLMSSDGKTLTVSQGSTVPGYGVVRVVNAQLGRVFTSSGRVIKFSQADS